MTFVNETIEIPAFVKAIQAGHAWTAPHHHVRRQRPIRRNPHYQTTYRVKENVIGSQLLALDCDTQDERSTFYDLLQVPLIWGQGLSQLDWFSTPVLATLLLRAKNWVLNLTLDSVKRQLMVNLGG